MNENISNKDFGITFLSLVALRTKMLKEDDESKRGELQIEIDELTRKMEIYKERMKNGDTEITESKLYKQMEKIAKPFISKED